MKIKLLLIDDVNDYRKKTGQGLTEAVRLILGDVHFSFESVSEASNSEQALFIASREKFDIIVLDNDLGENSEKGFQISQRIRDCQIALGQPDCLIFTHSQDYRLGCFPGTDCQLTPKPFVVVGGKFIKKDIKDALTLCIKNVQSKEEEQSAAPSISMYK